MTLEITYGNLLWDSVMKCGKLTNKYWILVRGFIYLKKSIDPYNVNHTILHSLSSLQSSCN